MSNRNKKTSEFLGANIATELTPEIEVFFDDYLFGEFDLPETHRNACNWLIGAECPLDAGERATYHLQRPINVDNILVGQVLRIKNRYDEPLFCFRVELDQ
jgi:hypothetical protein